MSPLHMTKNGMSAGLALIFLAGALSGAEAAWRTVIEVGKDNEDYTDFCQHDGVANAAPGSALLTNDDDTYLAGTYPAPVGVVATDETGLSLLGVPTLAVTWYLGAAESTKRIHFMLPAAEATGLAEWRLPMWARFCSRQVWCLPSPLQGLGVLLTGTLRTCWFVLGWRC